MEAFKIPNLHNDDDFYDGHALVGMLGYRSKPLDTNNGVLLSAEHL